MEMAADYMGIITAASANNSNKVLDLEHLQKGMSTRRILIEKQNKK